MCVINCPSYRGYVQPNIYIHWFPRNNQHVHTISRNSLKYVNFPDAWTIISTGGLLRGLWWFLVVFLTMLTAWTQFLCTLGPSHSFLSCSNLSMHTELSHLHTQRYVHAVSSSPIHYRHILQAWVILPPLHIKGYNSVWFYRYSWLVSKGIIRHTKLLVFLLSNKT